MTEKKILTLRTCKADFKKLADGEMKERYLEVKKYWETRVLEKNGDYKYFDEVIIKNGYSADSPEVILEFKGNAGIVKEGGKDCFKIELGEILKIKNYDN